MRGKGRKFSHHFSFEYSGIQSVTLPDMTRGIGKRIVASLSLFILSTGIMAQVEAPVTVEAKIEQAQIRAGEVLTVLITATRF